MREIYRGSVVIALFLIVTIGLPPVQPEAGLAQTPEQPNILFILTDDQDEESIARMPKLQDRLVNQGTTFDNALVTTPQCCPSRATFLRGQYAHNHNILGNNPPLGGFEKFRNLGHEHSTIATWLNGAGYTTAYVGKYMNGYGEKRPTRYVPPGWDRWRARLGGVGGDNYNVNENGEVKIYDRHKLHETDYYSDRAEAFVRSHKGDGAPWFMVVAPSAPHHPAYAAKRHDGMFRRAKMPKPLSFNEADVSDKPAWVRKLPRLDGRGIRRAEELWRKRQRSLQSVDDMVGNLTGALADTNQLDETYVVYASDNGYLLYNHRVEGKGAPYEESVGVPLIVRGPGVPTRAVRSQLVGNADWAPTIADWAGVAVPSFVDGRSFAPLLAESPPAGWREQLLIEFFLGHREFRGLRTSGGEVYVEYLDTNERELYDLSADRYQLQNSYPDARVDDPSRIADLQTRLDALENCAGETCRAAEDAP